MATEEKNSQQVVGHKTNGGSKKLLIIVFLLVFLLIAGGAGAYFVLMKHPNSEQSTEEADVEEEESYDSQIPGAVVPFEQFIVNLKDKNSYLKISLQLELFEPEVPKTMENETGKIKDTIIDILGSKNVDDLLSSEGKRKLKQEIVTQVNKVLGSELIAGAYITEFIIQ